MDRFCVQRSTKLQGKITTSGTKNAALPVLSTALLMEEPVETQDVPKLRDVGTSTKLLSQLGAKVECDGSVYIDARDTSIFCAPCSLIETMRASVWAPGPLVTRFGQKQVSLPGGYTIGARPVDLHISGLEQLDAIIEPGEGYVKASVDGRLKGTHIVTGKVSIGVMVTVMCAVTLARGITITENIAYGPEVVDTTNFLIMLGVKTSGQDIDHIVIEDVGRLGGGTYRALSDHIRTGTFLVVTTISRDKVICRNTQPDTLDAVLTKLRGAGADIKVGEDWTSLNMHGKHSKAINVHTTPHPALPTDMQTQFTLLNLVAEGTGSITKTIFGNRFMHVPELSRIGAYAEIESNTVVYHGIEKLSSAQVMAIDLHASASLVLTGCIAERTTAVDRICHTDRGYECIEDRLRALGTDIEHAKGE